MSDHQSAGVGPSVQTSATVSQGPQPPPISRTCTNCATAKIKCMRRDDSHICERCSRLHKECVFRPAKRRNNGTRKDLRIEALEAKFNQLLEAHQSTNTDSVSPPQAAGRPSLSPSSSSSDPGTQAPRIVETTLPRDSIQVAEPLSELHYGPRRDVIDSGLLSLEQAESLLNIYKRTLTPHFPFVILAAHTTAEELRYWKPFLFLAILAASSFENILLQGEIFKEVRKEICSRMILRGEVSFDLLQGLLVHLAWFMHSQPRQYSQILHLAVSIVADLRLNQPPRAKSQRIAMKFRPEQLAEDMNNNGTSSRASWGQDEQRAIAGCYYLSASTSIFLQKMTIFQHSTYLENCCRDLETRQLQPTDKYMLYIVQLQHIAQKIDTFFAQHGDDLSDPGVTIELSVMTLKSELDIFKERLPFQITESNLLMMQFHTIELYLYQTALTGHRPSSPPVLSSRLHLKMLCAGLVAAKTLLHFYISLPSRTELAFNNTEWIHLGFALLVSSRLSLAVQEDPIYADAQSLRHALDMSYVFNQCIERSHSLRQASSEKDVFFRYEKRIRNVQSWFERHTPRQTNNIVENGVTALNNGFSRESGTPLSDWELSGLSNIPSFEGTYSPNDIYNFTLTDNLPDSMEGVMGDWMSYPMVQF